MSNSPKIIYINYSICVAIILAVFTSMFDCLNPFKYSRINNNNSDDNTNTNTNTKVKIRERNKRCRNKIFPSNCLKRTVSVDSGLSNKPYNNKTAMLVITMDLYSQRLILILIQMIMIMIIIMIMIMIIIIKL